MLVVNDSDSVRMRKFYKEELVYVIGLHAVQLGNNSMLKISRTAKIGRGRR